MWCRETLCIFNKLWHVWKWKEEPFFPLTEYQTFFLIFSDKRGCVVTCASQTVQRIKTQKKQWRCTFLWGRNKCPGWSAVSGQHSEGTKLGEGSSGRSQALKDQHCVISYPEGETELPTEIATDAHPQTLICVKVNNLGWVKTVTFLQFCHSCLLSLIIFCLSFTSQEIYIQEMFQTGLFFRTLDRGSKYFLSSSSVLR